MTTLADKSGVGNTLTPSTGVALGAPIGLPGRLAMHFILGMYWSSNASMSDITSSTFFVGCITSNGSGRVLLGPSALTAMVVYTDASGHFICDSHGVSNLGTTAATITEGTPFVYGNTLTATQCRQYINLTAENDTYGSTSFTAGRTLTGVGADRATPAMVGWIGEILMYDTTLSDANAAATVSYLMSKWGIT
jgi:hypothetical protein